MTRIRADAVREANALIRPMRRPLRCLFLLCLGAGAPLVARADLAGYLARSDNSFAWELREKRDAPGITLYDLKLTSQTWQDITWQHNLFLFVPSGMTSAETCVLLIDGSSNTRIHARPDANTILYGSLVAAKVGAPCAVLRQVPNQPLLGGRREDALIAETFRRYLESNDATWPLLFPMTRAAQRAMDAVQSFCARDTELRIGKFILTGGSKRGWTTWLTSASDPRVVALAPMVIDVLNMQAQMDHQREKLGGYSDQTRDYHELLTRPETEGMRRLWRMIDPYTQRERITQPKLLMLGNNDPYWATDALNLYWDGLVGPKWIHYVPNAGHDLAPRDENGGRSLPLRAIETLGAFVRHQIAGKPFPRLDWKHLDRDGRPTLELTSDPAPKAARLWVAHSATHDFRQARWNERAATVRGPTVTGSIGRPTTGSSAFYGEVDYGIDGLTFHLSTQLRIVDAPQ